MDVGDQNGQNRHQHLIVVTTTFRLQNPSPKFMSPNFPIISKSDLSQGKAIDTENCPYFSAVLLEAQRFYPAGETIMHRTSEDIEFKGAYVTRKTK